MRRKRILHVIPSALENFLTDILEAWSEQAAESGIEFEIAVLGKRLGRTPQSTDAPQKPDSWCRKTYLGVIPPAAIWRLLQLQREQTFDWIHSHTASCGVFTAALHRSRILRPPLLHSDYGSLLSPPRTANDHILRLLVGEFERISILEEEALPHLARTERLRPHVLFANPLGLADRCFARKGGSPEAAAPRSEPRPLEIRCFSLDSRNLRLPPALRLAARDLQKEAPHVRLTLRSGFPSPEEAPRAGEDLLLLLLSGRNQSAEIIHLLQTSLAAKQVLFLRSDSLPESPAWFQPSLKDISLRHPRLVAAALEPYTKDFGPARQEERHVADWLRSKLLLGRHVSLWMLQLAALNDSQGTGPLHLARPIAEYEEILSCPLCHGSLGLLTDGAPPGGSPLLCTAGHRFQELSGVPRLHPKDRLDLETNEADATRNALPPIVRDLWLYVQQAIAARWVSLADFPWKSMLTLGLRNSSWDGHESQGPTILLTPAPSSRAAVARYEPIFQKAHQIVLLSDTRSFGLGDINRSTFLEDLRIRTRDWAHATLVDGDLAAPPLAVHQFDLVITAAEANDLPSWKKNQDRLAELLKDQGELLSFLRTVPTPVFSLHVWATGLPRIVTGLPAAIVGAAILAGHALVNQAYRPFGYIVEFWIKTCFRASRTPLASDLEIEEALRQGSLHQMEWHRYGPGLYGVKGRMRRQEERTLKAR